MSKQAAAAATTPESPAAGLKRKAAAHPTRVASKAASSNGAGASPSGSPPGEALVLKKKPTVDLNMAPSKRKRLTTTVEGQIEASEKVAKQIHSSTSEGQVKVCALQGVQSKLQTPSEPMASLEMTCEGADRDAASALGQKVRSSIAKVDSLLRVANAMHPGSTTSPSSTGLLAAITQCQEP